MLDIIEDCINSNWEKMDKSGSGKAPSCLSLTLKDEGRERGYLLKQTTQSLSMVCLEDALSRSNKMSIPIWVYNDGVPIAYIKYSTREAYNHIIENEYQNLVHVYEKFDSSFQGSVPSPIAIKKYNNSCFFIQSYISGDVLSEEVRKYFPLDKRRFGRNFSLIKKWLIEFQTQTKNQNLVLTFEMLEKQLLIPFYTLIKDTPLNEKELQFFDKHLQLIRGLDSLRIPTVSAHGDFFALNFIVGKNGDLHVIDWCDLEVESNPFLDIFTLASTFRLRGKSDQDNIIRSLQFSFLEQNWFSVFIKKFVKDFVSSLGYDHSVVRMFYPIFLINRIIREYHFSNCLYPQYWREHLRLYIENEELFWK